MHPLPHPPNIHDPTHLPACLQVNKPDWVVWLATFLCTMFLGVFRGILFGVGLALALVVYKTAFPRIGGRAALGPMFTPSRPVHAWHASSPVQCTCHAAHASSALAPTLSHACLFPTAAPPLL